MMLRKDQSTSPRTRLRRAAAAALLAGTVLLAATPSRAALGAPKLRCQYPIVSKTVSPRQSAPENL